MVKKARRLFFILVKSLENIIRAQLGERKGEKREEKEGGMAVIWNKNFVFGHRFIYIEYFNL